MISARFTVRMGCGTWKVWDLHEEQALASFSNLLDAESCRAACEMVRHDAQLECGLLGRRGRGTDCGAVPIGELFVRTPGVARKMVVGKVERDPVRGRAR